MINWTTITNRTDYENLRYAYKGTDADVLYGGAGTDELEGGAGADVLIGGTGRDTYVWNPEEDPAEDRVIDEDGEGVFVLKDAAGNINLLSGTYVQVKGTPW